MIKPLVTILCLWALSACATLPHYKPLSAKEYAKLDPANAGEVRWWGDALPSTFKQGLLKEKERLHRLYPEAVGADPETAPIRTMLSISGGGADGAFTAGILDGWQQSGKRPIFDVVSGVSTGAIIAPFAFLGAEHDETIIDIYSSTTSDSIFETDIINGLISGAAIADTTPLKKRIKQYITPELVGKIADEHAKDRKLYIITTHLNAMRPMVWDIGAIASWRNDKAVKLIRQLIQASSAIPVLFPPVPIEWESNGIKHTELHVDGGVTRNVFAYPAQISSKMIDDIQGVTFRRKIYVIHNSNADMDYEETPLGVASIAQRSLLGLLQTRATADIDRIYYVTQRDGVDFNIIEIPDSFHADGAVDFETAYMKKLIDLGRSIAISGDFWYKTPASER